MRPWIRCAVALIVSVGLSACATTETITAPPSRLAQYRGDTITTTNRGKPSFGAMTAGKAAFGLFGAVAMIAAGNHIVHKDDVADPSIHVSRVLLGDLVRSYGLTPVSNTVKADSRNVQELAQQYAGVAKLLLDVQTIDWQYVYFPTNWHRYRVIYSVKLRLIDTKRAKLIAAGFCDRVPPKTPDAPTGAQLLANRGAVLKQQLTISANYCIRQFQRKVLQENEVAGTNPASQVPGGRHRSAAGT